MDQPQSGKKIVVVHYLFNIKTHLNVPDTTTFYRKTHNNLFDLSKLSALL